MCEIDIDEYADVWNARHVKARKTWTCQGCRAPILPGERYVRVASLFDSEWSVERGCLACDAAATEFGKAHGNMRFFPSGFIDALIDCVDENDPEDAKWSAMLETIRARRASAEMGGAK